VGAQEAEAEGEGRTYFGWRETPHRPEVMNFSSCFFSSLSFLHADFSVPAHELGPSVDYHA